MLRFFLSIKTYLWITGISIAAFLTGSFFIPHNLAVFSGINDMPLLKWMFRNSSYTDKFFWIYILIALMIILWISTLICSIDAIIKRMRINTLIRVLSPQILHLAILFVLLGHGISAVSGYKVDVPMDLNSSRNIRGFNLHINDMDFFRNPGESSTRWKIDLKIDNNQQTIALGDPAFYKGVGFFAKSAQEKKMKAIIGMIYDPGVIWEIIGAVIFVIGTAGMFYTKLSEQQVR